LVIEMDLVEASSVVGWRQTVVESKSVVVVKIGGWRLCVTCCWYTWFLSFSLGGYSSILLWVYTFTSSKI
jgi:hypothetical protein